MHKLDEERINAKLVETGFDPIDFENLGDRSRIEAAIIAAHDIGKEVGHANRNDTVMNELQIAREEGHEEGYDLGYEKGVDDGYRQAGGE